jgi:hypothetical protein
VIPPRATRVRAVNAVREMNREVKFQFLQARTQFATSRAKHRTLGSGSGGGVGGGKTVKGSAENDTGSRISDETMLAVLGQLYKVASSTGPPWG